MRRNLCPLYALFSLFFWVFLFFFLFFKFVSVYYSMGCVVPFVLMLICASLQCTTSTEAEIVLRNILRNKTTYLQTEAIYTLTFLKKKQVLFLMLVTKNTWRTPAPGRSMAEENKHADRRRDGQVHHAFFIRIYVKIRNNCVWNMKTLFRNTSSILQPTLHLEA